MGQNWRVKLGRESWQGCVPEIRTHWASLEFTWQAGGAEISPKN